MDVGGIGGQYSSYSSALSGGPSAAARSGEAQASQQVYQAQLAQDQEQERRQAAPSTEAPSGSTTPTRGQNLNITV